MKHPTRRAFLPTFLTFCALSALTPAARSAAPFLAEEGARPGDKGTFLGILVCPVAEGTARLATTSPEPRLPSKNPAREGVVISHVLPDSPAARARLRKQDILLAYDGTTIRDGEHLANLIRHDKPDRKVKLHILRGRVEEDVEVTLALGPALVLSPSSGKPDEGAGARGTAKPASQGSVSVVATPLEGNKMRLTVEYWGTTGKLETVICEGAVAEVASMVQKLPERERNLVRIALERLRHAGAPAGTGRR